MDGIPSRQAAACGLQKSSHDAKLRLVSAVLTSTPWGERSHVYNTITKMGFNSPEGIGNIDGHDEFLSIAELIETDALPLVERVWKYCASRIGCARNRHVPATFPILDEARTLLQEWEAEGMTSSKSNAGSIAKTPDTYMARATYPPSKPKVATSQPAGTDRHEQPRVGAKRACAVTHPADERGKRQKKGKDSARSGDSSIQERQPDGGNPGKDEVERVIWDTAVRWKAFSPIFQTSERLGLSAKQTLDTISKAIRVRLSADRSIIAAAKHVNKYVDFVGDLRRTIPGIQMHGFDSYVAIQRYLDSLRARGRTVPATARSAMEAWNDALSTDLPLKHKCVMAECQGAKGATPKQAPMMPVELVRKLELSATDTSMPLARRAFCSGILLMTYGSFRFDDTKHMTDIQESGSAIHGVLSSTKNRTQVNEPWAVPTTGITEKSGWAVPILELRKEMKRKHAFVPPFIFPDVSNDWTKLAPTPAKYATVRRRLDSLITAWGLDCAGTITLHSPRNFLPSLGCQQGLSCEARTRLGHWSISSAMPERYNRLACVDELRIRNDLMEKLRDGWRPVAPFEVPTLATEPGLGQAVPGGPTHCVEGLKVGHGEASSNGSCRDLADEGRASGRSSETGSSSSGDDESSR